MHGKTTVKMRLGNYESDHVIWVADIVDQCIVGLDFLLQHNCQVDVGNALLKVGPEEVPMRRGNVSEIRCCRVVLQQEEIVPANSETLLSGKFTRGINGEQELGRWASVNPGREQALGEGLLVGRSLVDLRSRLLPVRVMNLSNKPRKLPKGPGIQLAIPSLGRALYRSGYLGYDCTVLVNGLVVARHCDTLVFFRPSVRCFLYFTHSDHRFT